MEKRKVIYKITYPNGKIYIGKDSTDTVGYFGSVDNSLINGDFFLEKGKSFSITKEILWISTENTEETVHKAEVRFIRDLRSNDPEIGYNRWPKFSKKSF